MMIFIYVQVVEYQIIKNPYICNYSHHHDPLLLYIHTIWP